MMTWLDDLVASGQIADIAMMFIALEVVLVVLILRRPGQMKRLALTLLSGFCLIGALSAALTHGGTLAVAAWLVAAMFAHVGDMATRLAIRRNTSR